MKGLYWLSALTVLYVYAGYPLLLAAWARLRARKRRSPLPTEQPAGPPPSISIVLAVRNEAHRLSARLDNLLALDYPAARRQIIVVSDGSRDDTAAVLARYRPRVSALLLPPTGKAGALNAGVAAAVNEIVIFADARQRFAPDALRHLVAPFADPHVGAVSGELLIDGQGTEAEDGRESPVAEGVGLYWRYEKWLRQRESDVASTLGATGAIYAMRRAAWRPLPETTLLDDVLAPMRVVLAGYRVVFNAQAKAYDHSPADAETERRRKVRTLAGNYQLVRLEPRLLVPVVNPVWLQFVSHKLGRLLVPYALAALFASNTALAHVGIFYGLTLALQVGFYVLAAHGAALSLSSQAPGTPAAASPAAGTARVRVGSEKGLVNAQVD